MVESRPSPDYGQQILDKFVVVNQCRIRQGEFEATARGLNRDLADYFDLIYNPSGYDALDDQQKQQFNDKAYAAAEAARKARLAEEPTTEHVTARYQLLQQLAGRLVTVQAVSPRLTPIRAQTKQNDSFMSLNKVTAVLITPVDGQDDRLHLIALRRNRPHPRIIGYTVTLLDNMGDSQVNLDVGDGVPTYQIIG